MQTLTPKRVANAIGVSESSLKRWCDSGRIQFVKTAGGHRRLSLESVLEFVRESGQTVVKPELLGLPALVGKGKVTVEKAHNLLKDALVDGDEDQCRSVLFDLHLAGHRVSQICDEVIAAVFHEIGDLWDCGTIDAYQERRACEVCSRALMQLRGAIPRPRRAAKRAIGCSPSGDPYTLPSAMIEMVFRQNGWDATSLGANLPLESLSLAVQDLKPQLLWLSVSSIGDGEQFVDSYAGFVERLASQCVVVIGGRALSREIREQMKFAFYGDNLRHLESFIESLDK